MNNPLSWLNRFEPTHLRRTTQAMLRHINDPALDEIKRQEVIDTAVRYSLENTDQLEYPELMLHLASFHFAWQDAASALDFAQKSHDRLPEGSHYDAVCCWILGFLAWKTGDHWLGFSSWYAARETFEKLALQEEQAGQIENSRWYRDLLIHLNMDMICKAEEAYTWLDLFDASRLSKNAEKLVDEIDNQLNHEFITEADKQVILNLMNELYSQGTNSTDPLESAEGLVECSMVLYRLTEISKAQDMLQKAIEIFPPQSHQSAVALWLLGIFEWQLAVSRLRSISHWEECLEIMGTLAQIYQQDQNTERANWYRQKQDIMARVLEKRKKTLEIE